MTKAAPVGIWSRRFSGHRNANAVENALQRLTNRGDIRRPRRGLYDKPTINQLTGKMLFPPRAFLEHYGKLFLFP
ncbi:hypothetical protein C5748_24975 [Phyllobacterium phragmitis]|uniref:Uncharacterized protein n=1 Tax=Phyllobacterium phragmitis TaxID=2670329 RepID=A0A2S9IJZ5_9HYPH|nr:hypothetical protein C5748_24975 [Phyllobacterium phragmitis]